MGFFNIEMASQQIGGSYWLNLTGRDVLLGKGLHPWYEYRVRFTWLPPKRDAAESLLGGSHVKHTRYSYQLTLAWFHVLKVQAYNEYCQTGYRPHESMEM